MLWNSEHNNFEVRSKTTLRSSTIWKLGLSYRHWHLHTGGRRGRQSSRRELNALGPTRNLYQLVTWYMHLSIWKMSFQMVKFQSLVLTKPVTTSAEGPIGIYTMQTTFFTHTQMFGYSGLLFTINLWLPTKLLKLYLGVGLSNQEKCDTARSAYRDVMCTTFWLETWRPLSRPWP
jgi:hypothetical protein